MRTAVLHGVIALLYHNHFLTRDDMVEHRGTAMVNRFLNLVFQGGGVRGVAYAGALQALPPNYKLHTVAGASAGAIVAALVGIGKTATQIRDLLSEDEFFRLIHPADSERTARLIAAVRDMRT